MVSVIKLDKKQTFAFFKLFNMWFLKLHSERNFLREILSTQTITALQHKAYGLVSQKETVTSYHADKWKVSTDSTFKLTC